MSSLKTSKFSSLFFLATLLNMLQFEQAHASCLRNMLSGGRRPAEYYFEPEGVDEIAEEMTAENGGALFYAAQEGNFDECARLINHGANPELIVTETHYPTLDVQNPNGNHRQIRDVSDSVQFWLSLALVVGVAVGGAVFDFTSVACGRCLCCSLAGLVEV